MAKSPVQISPAQRGGQALGTALVGLLVVGGLVLARLSVPSPSDSGILSGLSGGADPSVPAHIVEVPPSSDAHDDEVGINEDIAQRPTVPVALAARGWFTDTFERGLAGQLGSTARIEMSPGEVPIATADNLVATIVNGPLYARSRESTIRVRDVRTGEITLKVTTDLFIDAAVFAGGYLFYTGTDVNRAGKEESDIYPGGGVWAASLVEAGAPVLVVPPEANLRMASAPFGEGVRAPFVISGTGRTIGSAVYLAGGATGRVDVIDVAKMSVRSTLPRYVYALSDQVALMKAAPDSDIAIELVDLESGKTRWTSDLGADPSTRAMILYAFSYDDAFVLQFERAPILVVATIDAEDGTRKELLVQDGRDPSTPPLYMAASLSDGDSIVLLDAPGVGPSIAAGGGRASATLLDVATGHLTEGAFGIGAP